MNNSIPHLQERRERILEEMGALDCLRRGSLSRQFFQWQQAGKSGRHGPYYVLQGYFQGQKFSERVPAAQAAEVQELVANYQRFQALAEEFVTVTEQLTLQAVADSKKNSRRKSSTSSSGKPRPSSG
jgi:hypothetical protein